ncbi:hypothetical protein [Rhodococcus ruber]|uniref:hypothetical protein n=1 Tax=Rhodococcus ruber TaxID=1830 RepID=UPI003783041E
MDPQLFTAVGTLISTGCAGASAVLIALSKSNANKIRRLEGEVAQLRAESTVDRTNNNLLQRALVAAHTYVFSLRMVLAQNGIDTPEPPADFDVYERERLEYPEPQPADEG